MTGPPIASTGRANERELAESILRNETAFAGREKPVDVAVAQLWVGYAGRVARAYLDLLDSLAEMSSA